jgi:3-hydroxyisobutyrate dehydrogenase
LKVGFIGLGIMGLPMAKNLVKAGFGLVVYNRSKNAPMELKSQGAEVAQSPKDVALRSDVVVTMLPDSPDVKEVLLGDGGVIEGARSGLTVIDMSTIAPKVSIEIAEVLSAKGVEMLDAPVSGGQRGASEGTLSIMVGGKGEVLERCRPLFNAMGKVIVHVGGNGAGETVKLCNQVICALNIVSMCEGISLCRRAGVDVGKMVEVVSGGLGASNIIASLAPKILSGDMEPGFKLRLQQKDLRLALQMAEELRLPIPATSLAHEIFRISEAKGLGERGTQALIKAYELLG